MKKILVIEDRDYILKMMSRVFKDNPNVKMAECHNEDEALEAIRKHRP